MLREVPAPAAIEGLTRTERCIDEAYRLIDDGIPPIPLQPKDKKPIPGEWQNLALTREELRTWFGGQQNVGGRTGQGVVDVDADCREARVLCPILLPPTARRHGRPGAPGSHRWYRSDPAPESAKYADPSLDPKKSCMIELRSGGRQTMVPPSIHPKGEQLRYEERGKLAQVDGRDLARRVELIAGLCVIARTWPGEGARHDAALWLASALARRDLTEEETVETVRAVAELAGDLDANDRARDARDTYRNHHAGENTRGLPHLLDVLRLDEKRRGFVAERFGERVGSGEGRTKMSQADLLLEVAAGHELFYDGDEVYARAAINGHSVVAPVRERAYRRILQHAFYVERGRGVSSQAVQDAINTIEARGRHDGLQRTVHLRVAEHDGRMYLDLGNEQWQVVEIDAAGWRVLDESPVLFRRSPSMRPLPVPVRGGTLDELRPFLNLPPEEEKDEQTGQKVTTYHRWRLFVANMLSTYRERGPHPVLILQGGQGSAKTTAARVHRSLVDPNQAPIRAAPRDEQDIHVTARNNHIAALDNLSHMPNWLSDAICRLATGGGQATRTLYTNGEEFVFCACRPVILNGIDDLPTRGDLADRAVVLELPPIPDEDREEEATFWDKYERSSPRLLGAALDALSRTLAELPGVTLKARPRMADFARWGVAVERALGWPEGSFITAYRSSQLTAVDIALGASLIVGPLQRLLTASKDEWEGTASELCSALDFHVNEQVKRSRQWPQTPDSMGRALKRITPSLKTLDITVERSRNGTGARLITIRKIPKEVSEVPEVPETAPERQIWPDTSAEDALEVSDEVSEAETAPGRQKPVLSDTSDTSDTSFLTQSKLVQLACADCFHVGCGCSPSQDGGRCVCPLDDDEVEGTL